MDEFELDQRKQHLASETARIEWQELQRFFAQGKVIHVADELDLVEAAARISFDDAAWLQQHQQQVQAMSAEIAGRWYEQQQDVWCVVVVPWLLVQAVTE